MAEIDFPLVADDGHDDLPRTFRRARAEKEREAAEREASAAGVGVGAFPPVGPAYGQGYNDGHGGQGDEYGVAATVKRFDVPFLSLMVFFLKAVLAAIPALILLGAIIWFAGEILQSAFPWLLKMQIYIDFPQ